MESKDHARIHTGRNDRDGGASRSSGRALTTARDATLTQTQGLKSWETFAVIACRCQTPRPELWW